MQDIKTKSQLVMHVCECGSHPCRIATRIVMDNDHHSRHEWNIVLTIRIITADDSAVSSVSNVPHDVRAMVEEDCQKSARDEEKNRARDYLKPRPLSSAHHWIGARRSPLTVQSRNI